MSRSLIAFPRARDTPPSTPPLWARGLEQSAWEFTPGGKRRLITSELRAQGTSSGLRAALNVNSKSDKTATVKQKPSKDTQYYPPPNTRGGGAGTIELRAGLLETTEVAPTPTLPG